MHALSPPSAARYALGDTMHAVMYTSPSCPQPVKEQTENPYKGRDDFISDRDYGRYVKAALNPGMKVKARETYESVALGDVGVFRQTNDGTPPAQFMWEGLGDSYWVYWHQVQILPIDSKETTANTSECVRCGK